MDREFNKRLTKDIFIRKDRINEVCETEMIQEMLRALTDESLVDDDDMFVDQLNVTRHLQYDIYLDTRRHPTPGPETTLVLGGVRSSSPRPALGGVQRR